MTPKAKRLFADHEKPLTKADTKALWYAVLSMEDMFKAMKTLPNIDSGLVDSERDRLTQAKRALRKVNELRRLGA